MLEMTTHIPSSLSAFSTYCRLPNLFRVTAIRREPQIKGTLVTAHLYHASLELTVRWKCRFPDSRLVEGSLVRVLWKRLPDSFEGIIEISRLVVLDRPERDENLFLTVPSDWVADRTLVARAIRLWDGLPTVMQEAFNILFWESGRFYRYCQAPSSMRGHHDTVSGNLRHSVDTAEAALSLSSLADGVHLGVLTLAALLHDAGKADEYRRSISGQWQMTNRGELLGHKITIVEWLAVAREKMRQGFPENQYLSLVHALTAVQGASSWGGLRQAMTPEANILAAVDRASGQGDLMARHQSAEGGWGYAHPHLKCKPFSVEALGRNRMRGLEALMARIQDQKTGNAPVDHQASTTNGQRRTLSF